MKTIKIKELDKILEYLQNIKNNEIIRMKNCSEKQEVFNASNLSWCEIITKLLLDLKENPEIFETICPNPKGNELCTNGKDTYHNWNRFRGGCTFCKLLEKKPFAERMIGKWYWYIKAKGIKHKEKWNNLGFDRDRLSVNNVFFTESDCDKEIARRKALGNIMSYIRDNEIELVKDEDWGNFEIDKFMISGWNYEDNTIDTDICDNVDWSKFSLAFYSQEDREKVISNCGKDLEILLKK
jgi:hypothetical protein